MKTQVFCNYTLLDELGHGGVSTVYRARDNRNNQVVALKLLNRQMQSDPRARERFRREPKFQIRHPKIVPVIEADTCNGMLYFTMELVVGESLEKIIQRGPLTATQLYPYLRDVAEALDAAHQRGIIHRDIKPSNILIRQDNVALLTDFGVAKLAVPLSSPQQAKNAPITQAGLLLVGTAEFASPEVARGTGDVGTASDIYSLGVTTYLALVGHLPFVENNPLVLLHKHAHDIAPSLHTMNPNIPQQVSRVVMKALNKDPHQRYVSAGAFAHDFNEALTQSQAKSTLPSTNRFVWMGAVAVLLVAMIAAVLLQAQARRRVVAPPSAPPLAQNTAQPSATARVNAIAITVALPASTPTPANSNAALSIPTSSAPTPAEPIATGTETATAKPTQTARPKATSTLDTVATATLEPTATTQPFTTATALPANSTPNAANALDVLYNGGGYMRWGTPRGNCGLDGFDDTRPLWRFEVNLTLKNTSAQASLSSFAAQFLDDGGNGMSTCVVQGSGPLAPNASATVKVATYTGNQNVRSILISMDGGRRRLCFNGASAALC